MVEEATKFGAIYHHDDGNAFTLSGTMNLQLNWAIVCLLLLLMGRP